MNRDRFQGAFSIAAGHSAVSAKAVFYCEEHFRSGGLRLAYALVAATAVIHNAPLLTANVRHYRVIPDVALKKFSP